MEKKQIKKNSKKILDFSKPDYIDKLYDEYLKLASEHAGRSPKESITILGSEGAPKGYYTMFIKRDENAEPDKQVQISAFGKDMPLIELASIMQMLLKEIVEGRGNDSPGTA